MYFTDQFLIDFSNDLEGSDLPNRWKNLLSNLVKVKLARSDIPF